MRIPRWPISSATTTLRPLRPQTLFPLPFSFSVSTSYSHSHSSLHRPSTHTHPASWGVSPNPDDLFPPSPPHPRAVQVQPFVLETGFAALAKRPSRAFPPPFTSRPSASFSDPLTTYAPRPTQGSREPGSTQDPREKLWGLTNGDDALVVRGQAGFLAVLDGVGAWAVREQESGKGKGKGKGNAALWSRLVGHFWARGWEGGQQQEEEEEEEEEGQKGEGGKRLVNCLQAAYEETKRVTHAGGEGEVCGTTTACAAALGWESIKQGQGARSVRPLLYAANLGDCAVLVVRPSLRQLVYKSTEQWHWFDCPRQLGTNSPDTPCKDAVVDCVPIQVGDVILVVSDGVSDNIWENEICRNVCDSLERWEGTTGAGGGKEGKMVAVARELMEAARAVAMDPFAESPFMERAVEEGLPMEGGKMDDISVVVGMCKTREEHE